MANAICVLLKCLGAWRFAVTSACCLLQVAYEFGLVGEGPQVGLRCEFREFVVLEWLHWLPVD